MTFGSKKNEPVTEIVEVIRACIEELGRMEAVVDKYKLTKQRVVKLADIINSSMIVLSSISKNVKAVENLSKKIIKANPVTIAYNLKTIKLVVKNVAEILGSADSRGVSIVAYAEGSEQLLTAVEKYIGIANALNQMAVANPIKTFIATTFLNLSLRLIFLLLRNLSKDPEKLATYNATANVLAECVKNLKSAMDDLNDLTLSLLKVTSILIVSYLPIQAGIWLLYKNNTRTGKATGIIPSIYDLFFNGYFKKIADNETKEIIDRFIIRTKSLSDIVNKLREIGKLSVVLNIIGAIWTVKLMRTLVKEIYLLTTAIAHANIDSIQLDKFDVAVDKMTIIIGKLGLIFLAMILIAPLALGAAIASPFIALGIISLWLIIKAASFIKIPKSIFIKFAVLGLVILAIIALCSMLVLVSIMAKTIDFLMIGKFFLGLIAVIVLVGILGLTVSAISPIAALASVGLAIMIVTMMLVLTLSGILLALQIIPLDEERIKTQIDIVIGLALYAIYKIFNTKFTYVDPEGDEFKNWFYDVCLDFFGGIGNIVVALLTVPFVMLALMSVVIIVVIATALAILQSIDLDREKIEDNVDIVIEAALDVMNKALGRKSHRNFAAEENISGDKKGSAWAREGLSFLGGFVNGLAGIIEMVEASAVLAGALIAVTVTWMIAIALSILQSIDLDREAIRKQVQTVIDSATDVQNLALGRDIDGKENKLNFSAVKSKNEVGKAVHKKLAKIEWGKFGKGILQFIGSTIEFAESSIVLAVALIAVTITWMIASTLNSIQDIKLNRSRIETQITNIISCAELVKAKALGRDKTSDNTNWNRPNENVGEGNNQGWKPWIKTVGMELLKGISGIGQFTTSLYEFVTSSIVLVLALISVGMVWSIAKLLNQISNFTVNRSDIDKKIEDIIGCANHVKDVVFAPDPKIQKTLDNWNKQKGDTWWSQALSKVGGKAAGLVKGVFGGVESLVSAGILKIVMPAVLQVSTLADALNTIAQFDVQEDKIRTNTSRIINLANIVSSQVLQTNDGQIGTIDKQKVKQFGVYVDDSVKLMKQINKLDSDKLIKYSDMWVKMTEFMQEMKDLNIEELADAIVNKIAPAMEGISDNVDKMSNREQTMELNTPSPKTNTTNTAQPTDSTMKMQPEPPIDYTDTLQGIKNLLEEYFSSRT